MKPTFFHIARGGPAQIYIHLYVCLDFFHIQTKINSDDDSMVPARERHEFTKQQIGVFHIEKERKKDSQFFFSIS